MALWKQNTITVHIKQKRETKITIFGVLGPNLVPITPLPKKPQNRKKHNWTDKYVLKVTITFLEAKYGSEQVCLKTNYKYPFLGHRTHFPQFHDKSPFLPYSHISRIFYIKTWYNVH